MTCPLPDYRTPEFRAVDRVTLDDTMRHRWTSEIEELQRAFVRQNRRLGVPMSRDEVRNPAIGRIVDQIRILLRLIDVELLNYHIEEKPVLPPASIRSLIELNSRWVDRLENQVWLLEESIAHGEHLSSLLGQVFNGRQSTFSELDRFARQFADDFADVPNSSLLIAEPGMRLNQVLSGVVEAGTADLIASAVQSTRLLSWAQERSRRLTCDRRTAVLYSLLQDSGRFAVDHRLRGHRNSEAIERHGREVVAELVDGWRGAPRGLAELLGGQSANQKHLSTVNAVEATYRLVSLMDAQSIELAKKNVLADLNTAFSPAVRQLLAEAREGRYSQSQVESLLRTLKLNPEPAQNENSFASRLMLFKRLRLHGPNHEEPFSPVPRPRFLQRRSKLVVDVPQTSNTGLS